MTVRHHLAGLVAATLVAAAGLVGLSAAPAAAAMCSTSGISAVVDYNDGAGGGITTMCDPTSGSKQASQVFDPPEFTVRRDTQGAVCQVNSRPEPANCGKLGTQYWALYWSDGRDGTWTYSQRGDTGLTVPKNGSVAWVWQGPGGARKPGVAPAVHRSTPKPTPEPRPTPKPTPAAPKATPGAGNGQGTGPGNGNGNGNGTGTGNGQGDPAAAPTRRSTPAAGGVAPRANVPRSTASRPGVTPSAGASASTSATASAAPSPSVSSSPSESASPQAADASDPAFQPVSDSGGLPLWVPVVVILVLASGAGSAIWWRNRFGDA